MQKDDIEVAGDTDNVIVRVIHKLNCWLRFNNLVTKIVISNRLRGETLAHGGEIVRRSEEDPEQLFLGNWPLEFSDIEPGEDFKILLEIKSGDKY